ncbi:hypothetical protein [Sebaldella sp. S0638]|nr:hypothetical protein [Sebaldella sp. S0638]
MDKEQLIEQLQSIIEYFEGSHYENAWTTEIEALETAIEIIEEAE